MRRWRSVWFAAVLLGRFVCCHTLGRLMRAEHEEVSEQPFEHYALQAKTARALHIQPDGFANQISDEGFTRSDQQAVNAGQARHESTGTSEEGGQGSAGSNQSKVQEVATECEIPVGMRKETIMDGLFQIVVYQAMDELSETIKSWHKYQHGSADEVVEKAGEVLPPNGTLVDIGANIGYHTLLFAAKGYNVLAVEPMRRNLQALKASLCLNPSLAPRVRIVRAALLAPGHTGLHCVVRSSTFHPYGVMGKVFYDGNGELKCGSRGQLHSCEMGEINCDEPPVATLDQVLDQAAVKSIDFLRIEVGGFECEVLGGGESLWTRYNPKFLLVEKQTESSFKCVTEASLKHDLQMLDMKKTALLFRM
mmetsp:Transcript_120095/g.224517  ORF Transcript_120095/g.224517 Transcript_120095/m.224517 type:complete len:364 (+) Transcript_120095:93-1184(+)